MHRIMIAALAVLMLSGCVSKTPRGYSIAEALAVPKFQVKLQGVAYYFGNQGHPVVEQTFETATSSARSTGSEVEKEIPCARAFASALISLRRATMNAGGNAVINIKSNWKHRETSSETQYQCVMGLLMAGVALKGTVVRLRK